MKVWQDHTHGMMGRAPDYINRAMTGYAAGAAFLGEADPRFGDNAVRYHRVPARERPVPDSYADSAAGEPRGELAKQADPFLAARVKEETDAGIVIRGCRMLATLPISDEIMVFPSTAPEEPGGGCALRIRLLDPKRHAGPAIHLPGERRLRALAFRSSARLALRGDGCGGGFRRCVRSVGERVPVPRRQPLQPGLCTHRRRRAHDASGRGQEHRQGGVHAGARAPCWSIPSARRVFQHIQEKLAEMWVSMETMRAFLRAAEADARSMNGASCARPGIRSTRRETSFRACIRAWSRSSSRSAPRDWSRCRVEADLKGPLAEDIKQYYQAARAEAFDRIPLFRLAWDASLSAFGSRAGPLRAILLR